MHQNIKLDRDPPLARITFNRPAKRNSLSPEMGDEIVRAVDELNADQAIRVVIVTGAGTVFSSGGDLRMILELTQVEREQSREFMAAYYRKYFALRDIAVPTIAMINGHAIGAGLCVALACDLRTIADEARVGTTFVRVGLNVGMGGTYTLPRLVGYGRAAELLLTGELITARQALAMGLVNRVCAPDQLESETVALAQSIATHAPLALRHTKRSLRAGLTHDLDYVFDCEADGQSHCYKTQDIFEGVDAARRKREPHFRGE